MSKLSLLDKIKIKLFRTVDKLATQYAYNQFVRFFYLRTANSFKKVKERRTLTKQQQQEVLNYYRKLTGKTVPLIDHEYFYSRTGQYSKEYMPIGLYEADIIGKANRLDCYNSYSDKNLDEVLLPNVRHPHSILKNVNGYFYFEGNPVSKEEALRLCQNIGEVVFKPSLATKGEGVIKINVRNGISDKDGLSMEDLFNQYQKDFLIQETVHQHETMAALNPTSVNTIRILTYRSGMDVLIVYAVVRIGREGQVIDNQSAGGMSTQIDADGRLCKYAFGVAGDDMIERTDSGIVLEGYEIPSYKEAIEIVKKLHYNLPLFDLVGWDIAICEDGEPILIEWNGEPGPSQTACRTGFGSLTERIITEVWDRPNTRTYKV